MPRKKRYPALERARAAKAAKRIMREQQNNHSIEFPVEIQIVKHSEEGWAAQGELPIVDGGHFLVQGLGNSPEQALADMRRGFNELPFAAKS